MLADHFLAMYPNLNVDIKGELKQLKVFIIFLFIHLYTIKMKFIRNDALMNFFQLIHAL